MIIDSHQHFWQLQRGDYAWLTPALEPLYRDFLPKDLAPLLNKLNVTGTIVVQAAPTLDETRFLLHLAEQHSFILGVVGWVDMTAIDAPQVIAELAVHPKFYGIRPMLQDIAEEDWILNPRFSSCFNELIKQNLTFDALINSKHLPHILTLAKQYPHLAIVIDHAAKPNLKNQQWEPWASQMALLSNFSNVFCKLSGLFTEMDSALFLQPDSTVLEKQLYPYFDHLFSCFTADRIMWGSDYPVINLVSGYETWLKLCQNYMLQQHGVAALESVFSKTAQRFYSG